MGLRDWFRRSPEVRSIEDPRVPLSSAEAFKAAFDSWNSVAGVTVTRDTALNVPAVWCAVNFLSGTIASLPAPVYRKTSEGREKADSNQVAILLHDWVNDDFLTSYQWRKQAMANVLLDGRSLTFIEGKRSGRITNLWPIDARKTRIERKNNRRQYVYKDSDGEKRYDADEIIDIPFMMAADGVSHVVPINKMAGAIGLSIAMETYASKFFLNGGVPPLAMQMPAGTTGAASTRGSVDVEQFIKAGKDRLVLPVPASHRLEPIGFKPSEGQLIEARMMQLREIARCYQLPLVFLQDLEFGTYTNTEQQALILVKHTLVNWLECWEMELNAKLFGARSKYYVEFNVDALLRGDFVSRMDGYAKGIQNSIITPDEARDHENLPRKGGNADKLFIQGATVPIDQPLGQPPATPPQEPTP